ncbi:hypothetical protein O3G_MSEX012541 [Manduca sexta]|uniref:Reverse transcriptase Ty1/copia-type domain-containing protein n=1 Tax=Manduca sexta TaxID=7130 RepID=A0A921ZP19_MANSE|nr:hypothetical protein O3G_MSEX012541 [Manduca sexta]
MVEVEVPAQESEQFRQSTLRQFEETDRQTNEEVQDNENQDENDEEFFSAMAEISVEQALSSDDHEEWREAILSEIKSLIKNETWDIVKKPSDRKVVGCRYVLTTKLNVDMTTKKKARLVAKGFSQRYGTDYYRTYAPVARLETIRLLIALAVELNLEVHQLDVNTAYLNGRLDEEVYMQIPKILEESLITLIQKENANSTVRKRAEKMLVDLEAGGNACLLKRSLYGLKQAGRQWYIRLDEKLRRMNFKPTINEPCLYHQRKEDGTILIVVIYVDDILVASDNLILIEEFKKDLAAEFELQDFGPAKYCLGIEIEKKNGEICLSQRKYIQDALKRYSMADCKTVSTPFVVGLNFAVPRDHRENDKEKETWPYRELIGTLMYLSVGTRPDISNTVSKLAQFTTCLSHTHWISAKRVLRYLKKTIDYRLTFRKTGKSLIGYSDADWGNCLIDRRSYSGYAFMLGGATISWRSQKQRTVNI